MVALLQLLTDQRKAQILHPHPSQQGGRGEGVGPGHLPLRMGPTKCAHHSHVDPVGQRLVPWPHPGTCFYFGQPCALLLMRDSISMSEKGRVGIWGLPASSAPHSNSSETCHLRLQSTVTCFRGTYHTDSAITFTYL